MSLIQSSVRNIWNRYLEIDMIDWTNWWSLQILQMNNLISFPLWIIYYPGLAIATKFALGKNHLLSIFGDSLSGLLLIRAFLEIKLDNL